MLYRISQLLLEIAIRVCLKIKIIGKENVPEMGPYIIIANHSSVIDPPLIGMVFRNVIVSFLAKKELFNSSLMGVWVRSIDMVCIDRSIGISGMKDALDRLNKGKVLGIFPEGKRIVEGNSSEAKKGIGFIVARSKVPVVPVHIEGSGKALPKGGKVAFGTKVKVQVEKKITAEDPYIREAIINKDYAGITNFLMDRVKKGKV